MTDIRYYAITDQGRQRLTALNLDEACNEVRKSDYLRQRTIRIVSERRQTYEWRG